MVKPERMEDTDMATRKRKKARKGDRAMNILLGVLLVLAICLAAPVFLNLFNGGTEKLTMTVEAGSELPAAADFLPEAEEAVSYTSDTAAVRMNVPGDYNLTLKSGKKNYEAVLTVRDSVKPIATAVDVTVSGGSEVKAESFIREINDATAVTVRFAQEPDTSVAGNQTVTLILTDLGGNSASLEAILSVVVDTQAPVITGVQELITYVGDSVAYRAGVTAVDETDGALQLEVDSSAVDLSTPGVYTVTYRATDAAGNIATQDTTVTVKEKLANHVDIETIYAAVDAQLARFIREDMTDREKVEAIYVWTRIHFTYGGHTDTTDYIQSAYQFLTTRKGDCYGYFALQKLMLQRLGIPTIDVKKVKNFEGDSNHYWLLVSIDKGKSYYHMDNVWSKQLCLVTDAHLNAFSKVVKNCFNRDESLYPPTPAEDLPGRELPWNDPTIVKAIP